MNSSALVIFSGGQDSTTCLAWALKKFQNVSALTFDYGQRHKVELQSAEAICQALKVPQKVVPLDFLGKLNDTALTHDSFKVSEQGGMHDLPSTFVPGRNILFLNIAAAFAAPREIFNLVIGVCQTDFSGYPDCRENFVRSMETSLRLGLGENRLTLHTPLMNLSKAEIFELSEKCGALELVLKKSHTCYEGDHTHFHDWGFGCGTCPACVLRKNGWENYQKELQNGKS